MLQHSNFKTEHCAAGSLNVSISYRHGRNRLLHQLQMLTGLQSRSIANRERLQNEITLVNPLMMVELERIITNPEYSLGIQLCRPVRRQSLSPDFSNGTDGQRNNENNCLLNNDFLATHIHLREYYIYHCNYITLTRSQAIFSMSFFSLDSGNQGQPPKWLVSEKWWIYLATASPLTAVTIITVGILWRRSRTIEPYTQRMWMMFQDDPLSEFTSFKHFRLLVTVSNTMTPGLLHIRTLHHFGQRRYPKTTSLPPYPHPPSPHLFISPPQHHVARCSTSPDDLIPLIPLNRPTLPIDFLGNEVTKLMQP